MLVLLVAYMAAAILLNWYRHKTIHNPRKEIISQLFDAALFAGSLAVLVGLFKPSLLSEIKDTKFFLLIGGAAGVIYPLTELFPKKKR